MGFSIDISCGCLQCFCEDKLKHVITKTDYIIDFLKFAHMLLVPVLNFIKSLIVILCEEKNVTNLQIMANHIIYCA